MRARPFSREEHPTFQRIADDSYYPNFIRRDAAAYHAFIEDIRTPLDWLQWLTSGVDVEDVLWKGFSCQSRTSTSPSPPSIPQRPRPIAAVQASGFAAHRRNLPEARSPTNHRAPRTEQLVPSPQGPASLPVAPPSTHARNTSLPYNAPSPAPPFHPLQPLSVLFPSPSRQEFSSRPSHEPLRTPVNEPHLGHLRSGYVAQSDPHTRVNRPDIQNHSPPQLNAPNLSMQLHGLHQSPGTGIHWVFDLLEYRDRDGRSAQFAADILYQMVYEAVTPQPHGLWLNILVGLTGGVQSAEIIGSWFDERHLRDCQNVRYDEILGDCVWKTSKTSGELVLIRRAAEPYIGPTPEDFLR